MNRSGSVVLASPFTVKVTMPFVDLTDVYFSLRQPLSQTDFFICAVIYVSSSQYRVHFGPLPVFLTFRPWKLSKNVLKVYLSFITDL